MSDLLLLEKVETNTIKKFNRILNEDKKFETVILPLRDGISISRLV